MSLEQADDASGFLGLGDHHRVVVDVEDAELFGRAAGFAGRRGETISGLGEFVAERSDQFLDLPAFDGAGLQARHILGLGVRGQLGAVVAGTDDEAAGEGAVLGHGETARITIVRRLEVEAGGLDDGRLHGLAVLPALIEVGDELLDARLEGLGLGRVADLQAA